MKTRLLIIIGIAIGSSIISIPLYGEFLKYDELKQELDKIPCDDYLTMVRDEEYRDYQYLYQQKSSDCLKMQDDVESVSPTDSSHQEPDSDNASVIDANNKFALDFYSYAKQDGKNVFFSSLSIMTAFGIVYEGANNDTADEMQKIFGFPIEEQKRKDEFKSILKGFENNNMFPTS